MAEDADGGSTGQRTLPPRDKLAEAGVVEEDSMGAIEWLDGEFLSQERSGDDEFGRAEGDEPEMGDDEMGDSDG